MKKLISLILSFLMLLSLPSCAPEESSSESSLLSGTLKDGGRWFYAEVSYSNLVEPLDGTYEKGCADSIYVNPTLANGESGGGFSMGTIVKIEYDGNIHLPSGMTNPIISTVYSVSLEPYPFISGNTTYLVSCIPTAFEHEHLADIDINRQNEEKHVHAPYLLKAESVEEAMELYRKSLPSRIAENAFDYYNAQLGYYNDEFFKDNVLLLVFFSSASGGDRYEFSSIEVTDGVLNIKITQTQSGQTCDGSEWLFCISVPRDVSEDLSGYAAVNGWEK